LKETTCWVERTIQMVNYRLISLALTTENNIFSTAYNNYLINAWMGVTKPEQPQTLEEVIAHYKGDSRVVDANHDVFDYVMLRKEFTEDKQGNPTPEGQG
ncbi:hypothetical protein P2S53_18070, partial [Escherichia coli]